MSTPKVVRDGKVAVLISPGYGAGWSTWVSENKERMLFSPEVVDWVERGMPREDPQLEEFLAAHGSPYTGGLKDVMVVWLDEGTAFTVEEYDGSESLRTTADLYYVA